MRVYVVTRVCACKRERGEWLEWVEGVFSSLVKAQAYIDGLKGDDTVAYIVPCILDEE